MSLRIFHHTFGCKLNIAETQNILNDLQNITVVDSIDNADVALINSCAVTQTAKRKVIKYLRHLRKINPGLKIILTGCAVDFSKISNEERLYALADVVFDNAAKSEVVNFINNIAGGALRPVQDSFASLYKTRYFLAIETGCDNFCSYCIIPYLRGRIKSRSRADVINEFRRALDLGYKEIVLTGIHIGHYGKDCNDSLAVLLEELLKQPGLYRIRLSSIEINEITPPLLDLLKESQVCRHLHIPLQSGSDFILKRMNRKYDTSFFKEKVHQLRVELGDIGLTTDVIVGFPGEEEAHFQQTVNFIKNIGFTRLHVFPFSPMPGTAAFDMKPYVNGRVVRQRVRLLSKLNEELKERYKRRFMGKPLVILTEEEGEAYTGNYIRVNILAKKALKNRFYSGIINNKGEFEIKEEINAVCEHQINW